MVMFILSPGAFRIYSIYINRLRTHRSILPGKNCGGGKAVASRSTIYDGLVISVFKLTIILR